MPTRSPPVRHAKAKRKPAIDGGALMPFAGYIWWKTPGEAMAFPARLAAQVMDIGGYDDIQALARVAGRDALRGVLARAEAGWFSERSWHYWHCRLGLADAGRGPPPLPARRLGGGRRPLAGACLPAGPPSGAEAAIPACLEKERLEKELLEKKALDGKTPQEATQAGGVFKPRMEILPPAQLGLWPWLRPAAGLGFTLYGGTAVALRLGHRSSVDFDFFSEMPLDAGLLREALPFVGKSETLQERKDTLTVLALPGLPGQIQGLPGQGRVKVSFFGGIGFGRVGEPGVTGDGVLQVASLDDLMATKLKVVQQRAEAKDYRDIAAMLAAGAGLSRGLASARQMFGPAFQPAESLRALSYFGDGDLKTLGRDERQAILKAVGEVGDLPAVAILARRLTILAGEPPGLASGEEGGGFGPEPR